MPAADLRNINTRLGKELDRIEKLYKSNKLLTAGLMVILGVSWLRALYSGGMERSCSGVRIQAESRWVDAAVGGLAMGALGKGAVQRHPLEQVRTIGQNTCSWLCLAPAWVLLERSTSCFW